MQLVVGDITVFPIIDSTVIWPDPVARYPESSLDDWRRYELLTKPGNPLVPPDMYHESITAFLMRVEDRYVLIDAGSGPLDYYSTIHVPRGRLDVELHALGVAPSDIAQVILTHLHHDHVGWLLHNGVPFFPDATHICHRADWAHLVTSTDAPYYSAPLVTMADQFEFWEGAAQPAAGIQLVEAPGHTPGNSYVVVSDRGERLFLLGDVVHSPIELTSSALHTRGDVDPVEAERTRDAVVATLPGDALIVGSHFPEARPGRLVEASRRREWVPASARPGSLTFTTHG
jgi:glyoxylase-like metal-dependent hydrolase (beta-lactamase superfamily II)